MGQAVGSGSARRVLLEAAHHALAAPSIYNTQPWRWAMVEETLQLWADRNRQLTVTDADARQLMISCGCALHHAVVALSAAGWQPRAIRLPDPDERALLAVIDIAGPWAPSAADVGEYSAIHRRHTDRRAFTSEPVPAAALSALTAAAENRGAHLYFLPPIRIGLLREATQIAEASHRADPAYQEELAVWTSRPVTAGDGVPLETAVTPTARPVPLRDFAPPGSGLSAGFEHDTAASYGLIFTDADGRLDCLQAGEALSAVLLTAAAAGLSSAPISDIIEAPDSRLKVQRLLDGGGYPQIALRVGYPPAGEVASSPRRAADEVIIQ
jgi:nitroreductase